MNNIIPANEHDDIRFVFASTPDDLTKELAKSGKYRLLFVAEGFIFCTVNSVKQQLAGGDLICMRASDSAGFLTRMGEHIEIYAIEFSEAVFDDIRNFFEGNYLERISDGTLCVTVKLRGDQRDKIARDMRALRGERNTDSLGNRLRLSAAQIFYDCFVSRMKMPVWLKTPPEWFFEFYMLLSRHYVFAKPFGEIIAMSGKSREYISRLFKSVTGCNISDYIINQRIMYACNLLKSSNMEVMEISFDCGFENLSTFYHHFSKIVGMPPQRYRLKNQVKQ